MSETPAGPANLGPSAEAGDGPRSWALLAGSSSAFLTSAVLVLLGGYLELYGGRVPAPVTTVLAGTALYEALLILGLSYLFRVRGAVRESLTLAAILLGFLLDLPMIQQRYGWGDGPGQTASSVGFATGAALVVGLAMVFRIPLSGRMLGTLLASIVFHRFGPALLVDASEPAWGVAPEFVALGWLLGATLLPIIFLPPSSGPAALPMARLEELVAGACVCSSLIHFCLAGVGAGLTFRVTYLAPFVVLLGPALMRLVPPASLEGERGLLASALPAVGLAFSALTLTPEIAVEGFEGLTVTPFNLTLTLTILVTGARALGDEGSRVRLWHVTSGLVCLLILSGSLDLPEVLARLRYPEPWQALAVGAVVWGTIASHRSFQLGLALGLVALAPVSGLVAGLGYPFVASASLVLAWGLLALSRVSGEPLPVHWGLGVRLALTGVPLGVILGAGASGTALAVFGSQCALAYFAGRWLGDRPLGFLAIAALAGGTLVTLVSAFEIPPVPVATLLTRLGLFLFVLGILASLYGEMVVARVRKLVAQLG